MCEGMEMHTKVTNLCWALYHSLMIELRLIFNVTVKHTTGYIVSQILSQSIKNQERNCILLNM